MINKFEVYICIYKGEIVYVGYGRIGRHKHCISGVSHNYGLNELHFRGDRSLLTVMVVALYPDSAEAKAHETKLILENKPKFNVSENAKGKKSKEGQSWLDSTSDTFLNTKVVDK